MSLCSVRVGRITWVTAIIHCTTYNAAIRLPISRVCIGCTVYSVHCQCWVPDLKLVEAERKREREKKRNI